ncbi:MAG: hypothetical protein LBN00_11540 [Oscillospiraceae bacterium]|jgi:hypothetical protein|nr:hypothetical protein [Oscillospiraceae bacterium]
MNKQKLNVWGRDFELEVVFDCYEGESVLPVQKEALENFLAKSKIITDEKVMVSIISDVKAAVVEYCLKRNAEEIGMSTIDNIFKYVMPKSLYVQRTTDDSRVVGLMCAYKFDVDNGIAVVFKNEQFVNVDSQNAIL